jgi:hypothetical protein
VIEKLLRYEYEIYDQRSVMDNSDNEIEIKVIWKLKKLYNDVDGKWLYELQNQNC